MYQNILVPTDGSDDSREITEHAVEVAGQFGATVHALYVINTGALPSPDVEFRREFVEEGERIGRAAVDEVAQAAEDAGVESVTEVIRGTPYEEILDYADDHDVDLVVMGTHGRTGLRHFLLGSVAERVVRHADCPVLLVRLDQ